MIRGLVSALVLLGSTALAGAQTTAANAINISSLPKAANTFDGSEYMAGVQSGITRKIGVSQIIANMTAAQNTWSGSQQFNVTGPTVHTEFGGEEAYMGLYYGVTATKPTNPELVALFSLYSAVGYTATPTDHFKSALNAVATADLDSSWLWAFNGACGIKSTVTHPLGCVVNESDYNNNATNMVGLPATAAGPWGVAFAASGGGTKYGHAAYAAIGSVPLFNYGILIADYTAGGSSLIQTADIYSKSKAPYFVQEKGAHQYGLALDGTYSAAAIRLPNNSALVARNNANTLDLNIGYLSTGDAYVIGQGATNVLLGSTMLPVTPGTQGVGDATHRLASVYTGTVDASGNIYAASFRSTAGLMCFVGASACTSANATLNADGTNTILNAATGGNVDLAINNVVAARISASGILSSTLIRLPNNVALYSRNAANSADLSLAYINSGNNAVIGQGTGLVISGAGFAPIGIGAQNLGNSTNYWANAYVTTYYVGASSVKAVEDNGSYIVLGDKGGLQNTFLGTAQNYYRQTTHTFQSQGGSTTFLTLNSAGAVSTGYVQSGLKTVATLPTCNSAAEGARFGITDANAPSFGSIAAGGGTSHMPVYCNGFNWIIG